jgi:hypothetical protein
MRTDEQGGQPPTGGRRTWRPAASKALNLYRMLKVLIFVIQHKEINAYREKNWLGESKGRKMTKERRGLFAGP